jgi:hypothetical protein
MLKTYPFCAVSKYTESELNTARMFIKKRYLPLKPAKNLKRVREPYQT